MRRPTAAVKSSTATAESGRRSWIIFWVAVTVAVLMMAAWFPFSALLGQSHALSSTQAQLTDLASQDRALAQERAKLSQPAEISRLARQQYQLVQPGQKLVQVLPPSGAPSALGGAPTPGDPGLAPLVRPSAVALLPGGTSAHPGTSTHHASSSPQSPGIISRIVGSLEFWKG